VLEVRAVPFWEVAFPVDLDRVPVRAALFSPALTPCLEEVDRAAVFRLVLGEVPAWLVELAWLELEEPVPCPAPLPVAEWDPWWPTVCWLTPSGLLA